MMVEKMKNDKSKKWDISSSKNDARWKKKITVKYFNVYFTSSSKSNSSSPIEKKDDILKQRTVAISSAAVILQLIQEE